MPLSDARFWFTLGCHYTTLLLLLLSTGSGRSCGTLVTFEPAFSMSPGEVHDKQPVRQRSDSVPVIVRGMSGYLLVASLDVFLLHFM